MRRAFILGLLIACSASNAQDKVVLEFDSPGQREVWLGREVPTAEEPRDMQSLDGAKFEMPLGGSRPEDRLFVWDRGSGNLAVRPLKDIRGVWKLASKDFSRIGKVTLRLEHSGQPVAAANVSFEAGQYKTQQLVDPSAKGSLTFYGLPSGPVKVQVSYRSKGQPADPLSQTFDLSLERRQPDPVLVVALPDEVETVGTGEGTATAQGRAAESPPPAREEGGSVIGSIFIFLLALAFAIGIGYVALLVLRKNSDTVQTKLQQLGVQIPDRQPADPGMAAPSPIPPDPPQKIILDDAAPDVPVAAAAPGPPISIAPPIGTPRLVSESGTSHEIPEGLAVVGREDGLPISLTGESSVSRRHAELVRDGGSVTISDLGSTNGTYVNGRKLDSELVLKPGDMIQFGAVRFRFEG